MTCLRAGHFLVVRKLHYEMFGTCDWRVVMSNMLKLTKDKHKIEVLENII